MKAAEKAHGAFFPSSQERTGMCKDTFIMTSQEGHCVVDVIERTGGRGRDSRLGVKEVTSMLRCTEEKQPGSKQLVVQRGPQRPQVQRP